MALAENNALRQRLAEMEAMLLTRAGAGGGSQPVAGGGSQPVVRRPSPELQAGMGVATRVHRHAPPGM